MWRRSLVFAALLVGACDAGPGSGALDPFAGPSRGYVPDSTDGGGAGATVTGVGGGGGSAMDSAPDVSAALDADSSSDALTCPGGSTDLSNLGSGDFAIAFHIVTTQKSVMAIVNQRGACTFSVFWDVRQSQGGKVQFEIDNNTTASYESLESTRAINDGKPHDVVVARAGGKLTISVDGAPAGQRVSSTPLGALPPLRVGDDVCVDPGNNPPTVPLAGSLSGLCITRR